MKIFWAKSFRNSEPARRRWKQNVFFDGVRRWGQRGKSSQNTVFLGKRHDNKSLKVQILLSIIFLLSLPRLLVTCWQVNRFSMCFPQEGHGCFGASFGLLDFFGDFWFWAHAGCHNGRVLGRNETKQPKEEVFGISRGHLGAIRAQQDQNVRA